MARSLLPFSLQFLLCALVPLLITTVFAVNLTRCGQDMACLVSRCNDDLKNPELVLFELNQPKITLETCQIVVQIKKMSKNRYVLFLRLNYRRKIEESECYVAMEFFDLEFAVDNFDVGDLTHHFELFGQHFTGDKYDLRVEFIPPEKEKFEDNSEIVLTTKFDSKVDTKSVSLEKVMNAIRATETCSMEGLSHLDHLSTKEFLVERVDFTDIQLTCPESFDLCIAKTGMPPIRIREIYCENNQWQTNFFNVSDESLLGFIDESGVIADSLGNDTHTLTIVDALSIGCVKRHKYNLGCSECSGPPPHLNCEHCTPLQFTNASSNLECATAMCPPGRVYTQNGVNWSGVAPICNSEVINSSHWYMYYNKTSPIEEMSCLLRKEAKETNIIKDSNEKRRKADSQIGSDRKSENNNGKKKARRNGSISEGTTASEWLKQNWIGSILIPFIVIAVVGGCVVFLAFMLKTKDEQENLMREGRRREEEMLNEYSVRNSAFSTSNTVSSRSEEALV